MIHTISGDSTATTQKLDNSQQIEVLDSCQPDAVNKALEELIAGSEAQNKTLEEILSTINTMSEKDARRERMQEGALCLTGGMILGAIGLHAATGGKFDILKPTSKIAKFLETGTGKILAALTGAGGILSAMFGIKNLVNEVNDQNK